VAISPTNIHIKREKCRDEDVLLRTEHLNPEERGSLSKICSEYHDVFYLQGDHLSSTNAVNHYTFGTGNITRKYEAYRLPEAQKEEVDRQVRKFLC
jgi:hypothetical protein